MKSHEDVDAPPRANNVYDPRDVIGRDTLYMNWGLWDPAIRELDDAARALVLHLGKLAGIGPATALLDVGFGFGDQLLDWCRHCDLRRADAINVCPEQTAIARRRLLEAGFAGRVRLQVGDAADLPFGAEVFDAVTAVECAFHFHTRERFFLEAGRVLKDGGRLVLADFIGTREPPGRRQRIAQFICARYWGFAPGSFCSQEEYVAMLGKAGFHEISVETVTERVIAPGLRYARSRLWAPDLRRRMRPGTWLATVAALEISHALGDPLPGEYVLVRAVARRRALP